MKQFERNLYGILIILLLVAAFYYTYQYVHYAVNRVHLVAEPTAVPQTTREWRMDLSLPSGSVYNTPTYVEPPLPMHKSKKQRLVYCDAASGKLYAGSLANGRLTVIYQPEAGWSLLDYDLTDNGQVLIAVGRTVENRQGRANQVKGVLIDSTQSGSVIRTVFAEKGEWTEESWYELKVLQFSPDGRYIVHRYDGYGSEEIAVYHTDSLKRIELEFPAEIEEGFGLSYAGFLGSNLLLTAMEDSFCLYQYDLSRNQLEYGSYANFLPVNTLIDNGVFYSFGRTMDGMENYYLTRVPYLTRSDSFTALGEKGIELRSYLPVMAQQTAAGPQVVKVSTSHELINAIGSNRTIVMNPGTYDLSTISTRESKYLTVDDDEGWIIHDVENLTIRAAVPLFVELVASSPFVNVLNFRDCKRVTIEGLLVGHHPQSTDVQGAVFDLDRCTQMQIRNSVLFTSGMYGIRISQTGQLLAENTAVTDSTLYAAEIVGSTRITFRGTKFLKNRGGIAIQYSADILLVDCELDRNQCNGLLDLVEAEQVRLQSSRITGNRGDYLADPRAKVEIKDCLLEGNSFSIPYAEPVKRKKVD